METRRCSLCHCAFHRGDVVCDSPIYGDKDGVFHKECVRKVEAIIDEHGNDVAHVFYPIEHPARANR